MFKLALLIIFLYVSFVLILYMLQDKFLFHPNLQTRDFSDLGHRSHEFTVSVDDAIKLEAVHFEAQELTNETKTVFYFAGNAEDAVQVTAVMARRYPLYNWVTFNYRGYGKSTGSPTLKNIKKDTVSFYDYVEKKFGVKKSIFLGHSLGSGIASYLGSKRDAFKIVLSAPYDSIANVSKSHYPFIPFIKSLLRFHLNSVNNLKDVNTPVTILALSSDEVVPVKHARALKEKINNLSYYEEFYGVEHGEFLNHLPVIKKLGEILL